MHSVVDRTTKAPPLSLAREDNRVEGTSDLSANSELLPSTLYESASESTYSQLDRSRIGQVIPQHVATPHDEVSPLPYVSFMSAARTTQENVLKERKCGRVSVCLVACSVVLIIAIVAMLLGVVAAFVILANLRSEIASLELSGLPSSNELNKDFVSIWSDLAKLDNDFRHFMNETEEKIDAISMGITSLSNLVSNLTKSFDHFLCLEKDRRKRVSQLDSDLRNQLQNVNLKNSFLLKDFEEKITENASVSTTSTQRRVDDLTTKLVSEIQLHYVFDSCAAIATLSLPFTSGMYWVKSSNGSPVQVYCSTSITLSCNGVAGGWRRVVHLNTSDGGPVLCPSGLEVRDDPPSCRSNVTAAGCSSVSYSNLGIPYSCIYGKVNARRSGSLDGFQRYFNPTLEENYVDGVSLTHGSNPRNHIWTFVAGGSTPPQCEACNTRRPAFIENDFSCEINAICPSSMVCFDQLWNGGPLQCDGNATFYRQLSQSTTDDIEMRVCREEGRANEDILITLVDIYVV